MAIDSRRNVTGQPQCSRVVVRILGGMLHMATVSQSGAGKQAGGRMKIEIRTAQSEDAEQACELLRRAITHCCASDHRNDPDILSAWLGNKTPDNVRTWFDCSSYHCLVALDGRRIQGVSVLTRAGKIMLLYVAPETLAHGVGTSLLKEMETVAQKWGVRSLCVLSTLSAAPFYMRNGFVPGEEKTTAFGIRAMSYIKKIAVGCRCGG